MTTPQLTRRRWAIEAGALIDVTEEARGAGFKVPVAITVAVWHDCIAWSAPSHEHSAENIQATRLATVLLAAAKVSRGGQGEADFIVSRVPQLGGNHLQTVRLKIKIAPGDTPAPVITISHTA